MMKKQTVQKVVLITTFLCLTTQFAITQEPPKPFKFVVYGDSRYGDDVHRKLVSLITTREPEIVLHTGDMVNKGTRLKEWETFDKITEPIRTRSAFYPARGNHDVGGTNYEKRVKAPYTSGTGKYYSFDKEECHFVCVDTTTHYTKGSTQYQWLDKDLAKAQTTAKHIFVFMHEAPYSIGTHGSNTRLRKSICPLFTKYGVRVVFSGHDHIYYRTKRDEVVYFVSGGGGASPYPCDPAKGAINGDKWESVQHYIYVEVVGKEVNFQVIRANKTALDRYTIRE